MRINRKKGEISGKKRPKDEAGLGSGPLAPEEVRKESGKSAWNAKSGKKIVGHGLKRMHKHTVHEEGLLRGGTRAATFR